MSDDFKIVRLKGDILEIKIRDLTRRILYKTKVNIYDKKRLAEVFEYLRKFGLDVEGIAAIIKSRTRESDDSDWF